MFDTAVGCYEPIPGCELRLQSAWNNILEVKPYTNDPTGSCAHYDSCVNKDDRAPVRPRAQLRHQAVEAALALGHVRGVDDAE